MKRSALIMVILIVAGAFFLSGYFSQSSAAIAERNAPVPYDDSGSRTLILLRHAKSDKSNMNLADINRPLEESGRKEAKEMGEYLKKNADHLDAIISSPSVRTRQTLEIICPLIGFDFSRVIWDSTLYACTPQHLQQQIMHTSFAYRTVMYVGHNPSITNVANALQTAETIDEVKTCGAVKIYFATESWSSVSSANSKFIFYAKPQ